MNLINLETNEDDEDDEEYEDDEVEDKGKAKVSSCKKYLVINFLG